MDSDPAGDVVGRGSEELDIVCSTDAPYALAVLSSDNGCRLIYEIEFMDI